MSRNRNLCLLFIHLFLTVFAVFIFYFDTYDKSVLKYYIHEDNFSENITVALYFISSLGFLLSFKINKQYKLYLFLSFLCLFISGEELSWGQRIFNIQTPEVLSQANVQNETNFHNLKYFSGVNDIISSRTIFNGVLLTFLVIIPIANLFNCCNRFFLEYKVPVYPLYGLGISLLILIVRIFQKYGNHSGYYLDEVVEMSASFAFLVYSISELKINTH